MSLPLLHGTPSVAWVAPFVGVSPALWTFHRGVINFSRKVFPKNVAGRNVFAGNTFLGNVFAILPKRISDSINVISFPRLWESNV